VMLSSPEHGHKWFRDVMVPSNDDEPVELVLDAAETLQVVALDRDVPLRAITMDLLDAINGSFVFARMVSGDDGRAQCRPVAGQDFSIRIQGADLWQVTDRVHPTVPNAFSPVQVRRLGSAQFEATMLGSPLVSRTISLRSLEFSTDVAEWIAAGRAQTTSSNLQCDDRGRLRVDGLPNGPYRWSAKASTGEEVTGDFVVPVRSIANVVISLP